MGDNNKAFNVHPAKTRLFLLIICVYMWFVCSWKNFALLKMDKFETPTDLYTNFILNPFFFLSQWLNSPTRSSFSLTYTLYANLFVKYKLKYSYTNVLCFSITYLCISTNAFRKISSKIAIFRFLDLCLGDNKHLRVWEHISKTYSPCSFLY